MAALNKKWKIKQFTGWNNTVRTTDGSFARNVLSLKRLSSAVRRTSSRTFASYSRRESFEGRFSCDETVCRPPDPTISVSDRHRKHSKQTDTQSMPSALSVVRGSECKIIVNEKNAVQFCGSDARSLAVRNYSCCTEHTLHWDRSLKLRSFQDILLRLH